MAYVFALERTLTQIDYVRLRSMLLRHSSQSPHGGALHELLDLSDLVASPAVPPDVVTMHSRVQLLDESTGTRSTITLCYPADASPASGAVSVLAPLGTALLGLRVGDVARWRGPAGEPHAARVEQMLYQPEATGDYTR